MQSAESRLRDLSGAHLEGDHAARAARLLLLQRVARMVGESRVEHFGDFGQRAEPLGDGERVLCLPLDAHAERLDAAQHEPRVERREVRPCRFGEQFDALCLRARRIFEHEEACDDVVVSAQVFRAAVQHDVRAERQGLLEMRREEGIVDGEQGAVFVRERRERRDVRDLHHRVRRGLNEDELRLRAHTLADECEVAHVDVFEGDAVARKDFFGETHRAAVEVFAHQDVIARRKKRENELHRRHARGKRPRAPAAL